MKPAAQQRFVAGGDPRDNEPPRLKRSPLDGGF